MEWASLASGRSWPQYFSNFHSLGCFYPPPGGFSVFTGQSITGTEWWLVFVPSSLVLFPFIWAVVAHPSTRIFTHCAATALSVICCIPSSPSESQCFHTRKHERPGVGKDVSLFLPWVHFIREAGRVLLPSSPVHTHHRIPARGGESWVDGQIPVTNTMTYSILPCTLTFSYLAEKVFCSSLLFSQWLFEPLKSLSSEASATLLHH